MSWLNPQNTWNPRNHPILHPTLLTDKLKHDTLQNNKTSYSRNHVSQFGWSVTVTTLQSLFPRGKRNKQYLDFFSSDLLTLLDQKQNLLFSVPKHTSLSLSKTPNPSLLRAPAPARPKTEDLNEVSGATGAELEAGETLAEHMVCEEGRMVEASLCEGEVVAEEGGSLHGEDVMVEILGSDVFVDGVCTSSGDGIGESADDEDVGRGGGGELGEVESVDGEKSGLQEVGEMLSGGTESEGVDRGVEDSSLIVECAGGETQVVVFEEDTEVVREEGLTQALVEEGVESDEAKEGGVLANEVQDPIVENGEESSLAVEVSSVTETTVVTDTVSSVVVETVSYTTVGVEQDGASNEGSDAVNDLDKEKVSIPDDVETTVICSSTVVESVSIHTQSFQITSETVENKGLNLEPAVVEEVACRDDEMTACSKDEDMVTDACAEDSGDKQQVSVEVGGKGSEDHNNARADTVPSYQPAKVVEGDDLKPLSDSEKDNQSVIDDSLDEGLVHDLGQDKSSIVEEMEVDPQSSDAKQIGVNEVESEQLEFKVETGSKDNEMEPAVANRMEGESASKSNEDSVNSKFDDIVPEEKDQQLKSEECIHSSVGSDLAQLSSNARHYMEVQEESTNAEEVKEQIITEEAGNNVEVLADPASLCQPSQVTVEDDVSAMEIDVLPNQNLEIQDSVGLDGMLPCCKDDQNLKAEMVWQSTEVDNQACNSVEMDTMSNGAMNVDIEPKGPGEKDQKLKLECSDGVVGGALLNFPGGDTPEGKQSSNLALPTVDTSVIQDGTKSIPLAKVSNATTTPKQSFKIGECIQRAATQLTGPPSILRSCNDKLSGDNFGVSLEDLEDAQMILPTDYSSLDEMLSQLHLAAQDPFQGYAFSNSIVSFFSHFRDSIVPSQSSVMEKEGGKRKMPSHSGAGFPETFEFVDMNDSYWTDMVVQNGSLEQLSRKTKKGEFQIVPVALEPDKSMQASRRPYSRKRYRETINEQTVETQAYIDEKRRVSPAEIIMTFSMVNSVPSETSLNKMFRRFGPLKESETEVDRETCRARVVYKKGSDAEVAYSSAGKFKIFGPVVVNYQLNFFPFEPFKALYIPSIEGLEEATLYLHSQD